MVLFGKQDTAFIKPTILVCLQIIRFSQCVCDFPFEFALVTIRNVLRENSNFRCLFPLHADPKTMTSCGRLHQSLAWFCGMNSGSPKEPELIPEEKDKDLQDLTVIIERTLWKQVVNINAVIMMALAIFMWAFYA